ncbi:hypothetical protein EZS27_023575 [termite gut metagenome]|uniref:HTH cro/C1-type domain-containing protein n=1 Tax=termite gut metagenome TaxID=433724 RepID=A0A5J4QZZ2_9ZZZZ
MIINKISIITNLSLLGVTTRIILQKMKGVDVMNKILEELKIKAPTLANNIGLDYQRIFDIQSGKTKKVSGEVANAILSAYPRFNITWILTGKGDMIKNNQQIGNISDSSVVGANVNGNGNQITHTDFTEMIELQKGYQDLLKKKDEHISELLHVITKLTNK